MTSKVFQPREMKELQPIHGLWQLYHPENAPYRFTAHTKAEASAWQASTRQALKDSIA